jgi:Uma2 family endonuclease
MAPQDIDEQAIAEESIYDRFVTVDEFLRIEERSPIRHEYVGRMLFAMTGGSLRHSEIVGNVYTAVRPGARKQRCRIYASDALVEVDDEHIYYPDVVVACDARDTDARILKHPCLLVEVLSPSTSTIDRREKASSYRTIAALRSYLVVHQDRILVEHYFRDDEGSWHLELVQDDVVRLRFPDVELQMADIYEEFPLPEDE